MADKTILRVKFDPKYSGVYYVDVIEDGEFTGYEVELQGEPDDVDLSITTGDPDLDTAELVKTIVRYFVDKGFSQ